MEDDYNNTLPVWRSQAQDIITETSIFFAGEDLWGTDGFFKCMLHLRKLQAHIEYDPQLPEHDDRPRWRNQHPWQHLVYHTIISTAFFVGFRDQQFDRRGMIMWAECVYYIQQHIKGVTPSDTVSVSLNLIDLKQSTHRLPPS